jgi:WD40 repeat protein
MNFPEYFPSFPMSYADLLNCIPSSPKRTTSDRLLSPPRSLSPRSLHPPPETLSPPLFQRSLLTSPKDPFIIPSRSDQNSPPSSPTRKRIFPAKSSLSVPLPDIPSDFYLSPLDWSSSDIIGIALPSEIVFLNPKTTATSALSNCPSTHTCLKFESNGSSLAVGTDHGKLFQYNFPRVRSSIQLFHSAILCCVWYNHTIIAGTRNGLIGFFDTQSGEYRIRDDFHREEICSISFCSDSPIFATSSNDTTVKIWDIRKMESPLRVYDQHLAAVRAISWSPLTPGIIASGGGTSDRMIRIWNIENGETLNTINTGSQICNLYWNEDYNEIVSTHGFSQHQLAVWKGSDLSLLAQFYEHKERVLFMAKSPDGCKVITAAPKDDLKIWKLFPSKRMSLFEEMLLVR